MFLHVISSPDKTFSVTVLWVGSWIDTSQTSSGESPKHRETTRNVKVSNFLKEAAAPTDRDRSAAAAQTGCNSLRSLTCEMFGELLLQLGGSVEGFPALLLRQTLVHLPAGRKPDEQRKLRTLNWTSQSENNLQLLTHMMFSTDLGLMKMAMG